MKLNLSFEIDLEEVLRMLGAQGTKEQAIRDLSRQAAECVQKAAVPRATYQRMPCERLRPLLLGRDIEMHLQGCSELVAIACTLGRETDCLIQRMEFQNMALAVAVDAAASVGVESLAQNLEQQLRDQLEAQGLFLTGRFSPGYGDYPIRVQNGLLALLDTPRRIGLMATETHLLTPRKSITALCGVASHPVTGRLAGCEHCALRDKCTKRKEGKTCV